MKTGRFTGTVLAIGVAASMVLCGCTGSGTTEKESSAEGFTPRLDTEAEVSLNVVGSYSNFEALEQVIADFNEYYPNVEITYEEMTSFGDSILSRCASGSNVDIIFFAQEWYDGMEELEENYLEDLDEADIDLSAVTEEVLAQDNVDGKQYFVPIYLFGAGLIVNTDLLEEYGIDMPTTYDEFLEACEAFSEAGIAPILAHEDIRGVFFWSNVYDNIYSADNSEEIVADLNEGKDTYGIFDSCYEDYQELLASGYFNAASDEVEDTYESSILRFLEGDIPFLVGTSDTISGVKKREAKSDTYTDNPFNYTFILTPTKSGENYMAVSANRVAVFKGSENLDYANEFLRFLVTGEELATMSNVKGMPTTGADTGDSRFTYLEEQTEGKTIYYSESGLNIQTCAAIRWSAYQIPEGEEEASEFFEDYMQK